MAKRGDSFAPVLSRPVRKICVIWSGLRKFLEMEFVSTLSMKKARIYGPIFYLEVERCIQNF